MQKCSHCKGDIPKGATKCKHCGADLRNWFRRHWIITFILILILIGSVSSRSTEVNERVDRSTQKTIPSTSLGIGDEGIVHIDGAVSIPIAISEEAFEKYVKTTIAKDDYGIAELVLSEQLFAVPNDTKVKVIEKDFAKRKVRILEGDKAGMSGWVAMEFVRKN